MSLPPPPAISAARSPARELLCRTVVATLVSDNIDRTYRLHTPPSPATATAAPLVVVLHGASGNAGRVELRYHWDSLSDRTGFVVVYPQGIGDRWNTALDPHSPDDVRFLTALIDHLIRTMPIDPGRVFVAGMSNGGAMAYRIGCALSDRIAAIATVEAWNPGCHPPTPVSMVAVHGLADGEVPFAGAQQAVAAWRDDDRCPAGGRSEQNGLVTHHVWAPCAFGTVVELYAVAGSGHEWPGSWPPLAGHDLPSTALDATRAIWDAFSKEVDKSS